MAKDLVVKQSTDVAVVQSTLREELLAEQETPCKFKLLLDSMPGDLSDEVVDVLKDAQFSTASVVRALAKKGFKADRHRINECRKSCDCSVALTPHTERTDDIR